MKGLIVEDLRYLDLGPFSFGIAPGECVGLSGSSGAGKTLLLRAVVDLDPHAGTVRLDGVDSHEVPAPRWRRRVGTLPDRPEWWHVRVGEHFDPDPELLTELGLGADAMDWPVSQLSAGESQRLALLRLLSCEPEALLLDEPTAHLDADGAKRVEGVLARVRRERRLPVLWVSHDSDQLARVASRVLHLDAGRLEERQP